MSSSGDASCHLLPDTDTASDGAADRPIPCGNGLERGLRQLRLQTKRLADVAVQGFVELAGIQTECMVKDVLGYDIAGLTILLCHLTE